MLTNIAIQHDEIAEFCDNNHIRRLSLFGSILRDDFRPDSDVDMLVEFEPGAVIGLIKIAGMEITLSEIIGRKVDLRTAEDLSRHFRQKVVSVAENIYERK